MSIIVFFAIMVACATLSFWAVWSLDMIMEVRLLRKAYKTATAEWHYWMNKNL